MAKKSKTQRAKASARRAEKREEALVEVDQENEGAQEGVDKSFTIKKTESKTDKKAPAKVDIKPEKPKKEPGRIALFFQGVRSEMRRVTWPSRLDVARWSGVVVAALLFFGLYVFVLDNWVVTPVLLAISSLGA